ncbi:MAG: T9SS type A sorting domain-containing protein [Ignavibacteria bacterium]|nr:T9SS type A sorting domain-containing protein [Ignavibacteria bacterium]
MKIFHKLFLLVIVLSVSLNLNTGFGFSNDPTDGSIGLTVVPNNYSGLQGTATFLGPLANAQRTYQLLIHANQLTAITGSQINAIAFRLPVSATADWPDSDISYSAYDIYLSGSVDPVNRSLTFANNVVGTQTLVRSGVLNITANTYRFGSTPNDFGDDIVLTTPWLYTGGNLLIEIRHMGFTGTSRSVDAIGTGISGYGTDFSACWQSSYVPTTGLQGNFAVTRINSNIIVGLNNNNEIPDRYDLEQNYPNPFNPVTLIKYSIASSENVKLKVYDILGNEVMTLVNSKQNAGIYEMEFDGSNLSSGIYIAKLTAGNYSRQIKMILSK